MIFQVILFVAITGGIAHGSFALDPEEMAAVQERLANYETLEKVFQLFLNPAEAREECLPEGSECTFGSGPNCCGVSTRCIVWDTQLPAKKRGGSATWVSKCRKYKLGVALEKIGDAFSG